MRHIEIEEAQAQMATLLDALQSGAETQIVITRSNRPAALLLPPDADADAPRSTSRLRSSPTA